MSERGQHPMQPIDHASSIGSVLKSDKNNGNEVENKEKFVAKENVMKEIETEREGKVHAGVSIKEEGEDLPDETSGTKGPSYSSSFDVYVRKNLCNKFNFIKSCLKVVLNVHPQRRHELVCAMSSKLKEIEAMTSGKWKGEEFPIKAELPSCSVNESSEEFQLRDYCGQEKENSEATPFLKPANNSKKFRLSSALIEKTKGGRMCAVCYRSITNSRRTCTSCATFVCRARAKCKADERQLPSCGHKNFSCSKTCGSCRLWKYVKLSKMKSRQTMDPRKSKFRAKKKRRVALAGEPQKCDICGKVSLWFKKWRCCACHVFHLRLISRYEAGKALPACVHDEWSYAELGCRACRLAKLQREALHREPSLAARLPI